MGRKNHPPRSSRKKQGAEMSDRMTNPNELNIAGEPGSMYFDGETMWMKTASEKTVEVVSEADAADPDEESTTVSPGGTVKIASGSIGTATAGGGGLVYPTPTWPTTTTSPTWTTGGAVMTPKKKPAKVQLPSQVTEKILVAFLDKDDDHEWAKKLEVENVEIFFDDEGNGTMTLRLSLDDVYGNES